MAVSKGVTKKEAHEALTEILDAAERALDKGWSLPLYLALTLREKALELTPVGDYYNLKAITIPE